MKRKLLAGITAVVLVLGIGNVALAHGDGPAQGEGFWQNNFEEMLPFMKEMHPDFNEEQLEGMYQDCHGQNGPNGPNRPGNNGRNMMNNF